MVLRYVLNLPLRWGTDGKELLLLVVVVGALPGVIVALALVAITVRVALPLYQTAAMLLAAYVLLYMPRAIIAVRASLAQVPPALDPSATILKLPT